MCARSSRTPWPRGSRATRTGIPSNRISSTTSSSGTPMRTWRTLPGRAASARTPTSPSRCAPRAKRRSPSRGRTTKAASFIRRLTSGSRRRPHVRSRCPGISTPGRAPTRFAPAIAVILALLLPLAGAASARAQSTNTNASPSHTTSRDSLVPASLTADSATRAALASRLPRERFDTVRAFPLRMLAPGAYAVMGDSGMGSEGRSNAGFIVGNDGVIVVDALASPGQAEVLLRTIRTVTSLPVRWMILTHHHPDHTFGAIVFKRLGALIIAHPDRRTLAAADGDDALASAWTGVMGLRQMQGFAYADVPDVSVTHDTTFVLGGRTITLIHPGTPHTAGDLMVWLPTDRVLYAGDVLVEDGVTMVVDGTSTDLLGALDRIS